MWNRVINSLLFVAVFCEFALLPASGFSVYLPSSQHLERLRPVRVSTDFSSQDQDVPSIESMRVKEIQNELKQRNISYSDCFDKESLVKRLKEARNGTAKSQNENKDSIKTEEEATNVNSQPEPSSGSKKDFDRVAKLQELRSMRIRELKEECGRRRIRWAQFVEKEDFVQALIKAIESAADFSVSGVMQPGEVTDLSGDQLEQELSQPSDAPLLLDIYATWCGPCQMMAPQLKEAAAELGDRMRVGKIDADKYPNVAQKLKAGGLPTVLILNGKEELQRIERALMKDQILQFVGPYI